MLEEIRKRDASYGERIPEHYQGPMDRRYLLNLVDQLKREVKELYENLMTS